MADRPGWTAQQALTAVTVGGARVHRPRRHRRSQAGCQGRLCVPGRDPFAYIAAVHDVRAVFQDGAQVV
jgi:hypothetical protein